MAVSHVGLRLVRQQELPAVDLLAFLQTPARLDRSTAVTLLPSRTGRWSGVPLLNHFDNTRVLSPSENPPKLAATVFHATTSALGRRRT
jgi:hypothetical protein